MRVRVHVCVCTYTHARVRTCVRVYLLPRYHMPSSQVGLLASGVSVFVAAVVGVLQRRRSSDGSEPAMAMMAYYSEVFTTIARVKGKPKEERLQNGTNFWRRESNLKMKPEDC